MSHDDTRAADSDRAATIERLTAALAEGRIDLAEFDRRTVVAAGATTVGELVPLTADVPVPARQAQAEQRRRDRSEWLTEWRYWLGGALIMNAVWGTQCLRDGQLQRYWPVAPLGIWAAVLIAVAIWPRDRS
ncbi:hypothetical protein ACWT_3521 [Actinoplanes sp. SE50]|uniref:DUF1707 SHOCT-like domain-containing protein n=1 Tax=unclassified Actinoplanes TaxID=2626549 RepID=UPI00023EBF0D|nr:MULTISPECIES: DUF1707 domain-containing protein [unclassified Actinoplanes]AEV84544.1 uncharacterized protein ACPL_3649 [Actinoplanes sp. SE50/110]ATO82936.1 hypothetical protein ACWT_3521 [Actinoplanes sp. SE50]SLM00344.1 hypothetical protein ACSP50_3576 [Actinoplanes sp. SE50/110]